MNGFHTWQCRCERVGRDSSCGHEESHLMHDTKTFHIGFHDMEYDLMFYVCHCMCILGGSSPCRKIFYWALLTLLWDHPFKYTRRRRSFEAVNTKKARLWP